MIMKLFTILEVCENLDKDLLAEVMEKLCAYYYQAGKESRNIGPLKVQWPIFGLQTKTIFMCEVEDET